MPCIAPISEGANVTAPAAGLFPLTVCTALSAFDKLVCTLAASLLLAIAALAEIVAALPALTGNHLTKIPKRYAVGHGCHEPVVMIRFEDEPAYGLSVTQAAALAEALLEEAEAVSDTMYCMRQ